MNRSKIWKFGKTKFGALIWCLICHDKNIIKLLKLFPVLTIIDSVVLRNYWRQIFDVSSIKFKLTYPTSDLKNPISPVKSWAPTSIFEISISQSTKIHLYQGFCTMDPLPPLSSWPKCEECYNLNFILSREVSVRNLCPQVCVILIIL